MILLRIFTFFIFFGSLFSLEEQSVNIHVIIPPLDVAEAISDATLYIGSFFTPNNQSYPLTPDEIRKNDTYKNIFSVQEAFCYFKPTKLFISKSSKREALNTSFNTSKQQY